ncbi:MAG: PBSX family phage terminase large subunit [Christensenellales bacterium]
MAERDTTRQILVPKAALNAVYRPYLTAAQPTQIFFGGAGSGKSVFLAGRSVLDALCGRNTLILRQVARTLRHSCVNEVEKAIGRFNQQESFLHNKAEMSFHCLSSGAQILFAGLDDAEKVKSLTPRQGALTDIWVEEATQCRGQDIKQLEKRLRGLSPFPKRLTLSFNPVSRAHWLYGRYFQDWQEGQRVLETPDLLILRTTHEDNAFLTEGDHAALLKEGDSYFHRVYTLGEWGERSGLIFERWRVEDLGALTSQADHLRFGLDFGYAADPCAAVKLHLCRDRIYVLDELYLHGLSNEALAAHLLRFCGGQPLVCDSAEPKSIAELRRCGVQALAARKGPDSVRYGLQWMGRHELVVDFRCRNFLRELQSYRWRQDSGGAALPIPEGPDHLMDAARYALEGDSLQRFAR